MKSKPADIQLRRLDDYRWEVPQTGKMRTRGLIYATRDMLPDIRSDQSIQQVANVATLPGIEGASMAMPDIHWGYGFPIGGVAAFDMDEGVISPGGVGYDINCGVRLAAGRLDLAEVSARAGQLADALLAAIPCGVGSTGGLHLTYTEERRALAQGARWALKRGLGEDDDIDRTEDGDLWATSRNGLHRRPVHARGLEEFRGRFRQPSMPTEDRHHHSDAAVEQVPGGRGQYVGTVVVEHEHAHRRRIRPQPRARLQVDRQRPRLVLEDRHLLLEFQQFQFVHCRVLRSPPFEFRPEITYPAGALFCKRL